MKYGESTFDILYLLFAVISGCMILKNAKNRCESVRNSIGMTWGIIRNIPFVILGAVICVLFFSTRDEKPACRQKK